MKLVIVGAGAMGCLFAALLKMSGRDIGLLEKDEETVELIGSRGIVFEGGGERRTVEGVAVTRDAAHFGHAEYVLFLVKACDTEQAAAAAQLCVGPRTSVVTLQNGIGNVEILAACFPEQPVLAGITAHGATLLSPGHVRHAGSGETRLACLHSCDYARAAQLCNMFAQAGISTHTAEDLQGLLWDKLLVNIGINPLTALLNVNNGGILELEHARGIMRAAVTEACGVAAVCGIRLSGNDPVERVEQVCRATQDNISSMLQDIRFGRRTEIDYMNGAVVREARAWGLDAPVNTLLTDLVRARQQRAARPNAGGLITAEGVKRPVPSPLSPSLRSG